jgi:hypothetical protein
MKQEKDLEIKLDAAGRVDVEYYVSQAHQMRGEYLATAGQQLIAWIARLLKLNGAKVSFSKLAHH